MSDAFLVALVLILLTSPVQAHEEHPRANYGSALGAARAAQAIHDFDTALALTEQALRQRYDNDEAWLLRATLHLLQGDIDEAANACRQLRRLPLLAVVTCHARVALANGDVGAVRLQLEGLIAATDQSSVDLALFAWALSVAGDLAVAAGEPYRGIDFFRRSLKVNGNAQVRSVLVDVLISRDRWWDAAAALDGGTQSLALQVQALIVSKHLGENIDTRVRELNEKFQSWLDQQQFSHAREMARFYLDVVGDRELARDLALINVDMQREPEDMLLLQRARQSLL